MNRNKEEWLEIIKAAELFNGGCSHCGTRKGKLLFHHKDPLNNEYDRGFSYELPVTIDRLYELICECKPLCYPCHRAIHLDMEACNEDSWYSHQSIDTTPELTGKLTWKESGRKIPYERTAY